MNEHGQDNFENNQQPVLPTQAELYESLQRIGALEDEKQSVQAEIDRRTDELSQAMKHIDKDSLLYKMLHAALGNKRASTSATGETVAKKRTARRTTKKRSVAKK